MLRKETLQSQMLLCICQHCKFLRKTFTAFVILDGWKQAHILSTLWKSRFSPSEKESIWFFSLGKNDMSTKPTSGKLHVTLGNFVRCIQITKWLIPNAKVPKKVQICTQKLQGTQIFRTYMTKKVIWLDLKRGRERNCSKSTTKELRRSANISNFSIWIWIQKVEFFFVLAVTIVTTNCNILSYRRVMKRCGKNPRKKIYVKNIGNLYML